jgi:hypothetical protein
VIKKVTSAAPKGWLGGPKTRVLWHSERQEKKQQKTKVEKAQRQKKLYENRKGNEGKRKAKKKRENKYQELHKGGKCRVQLGY